VAILLGLRCRKCMNRRRNRDVENQLPKPAPSTKSMEVNARQEYLHRQMRTMLKQLEGTVGEGNAGLTRQNEELRAKFWRNSCNRSGHWGCRMNHPRDMWSKENDQCDTGLKGCCFRWPKIRIDGPRDRGQRSILVTSSKKCQRESRTPPIIRRYGTGVHKARRQD